MSRPRLKRVTCSLWRMYRKADGTVAFYYRIFWPKADGGRRRQAATVPRLVASRPRDRKAAIRWIAHEEERLNSHLTAGHDVTLAEAIARYVDHMTPRWRRATLRMNRSALNALARAMGADTRLADVAATDLIDYFGRRLRLLVKGERAWTVATHNKHLRTVRAFFSRMVSPFDLLAKSPAAGLDEIDDDTEPGQKPTLTDEQAARIVREAMDSHPVYGLAIWVLAETGCRIMEVMTRTWDDIEFFREDDGAVRGAVITLGRSETKGKRPRIPPALSPELAGRLLEYRTQLELEGRLTGYALRPWTRKRKCGWVQFGDDWTGKQVTALLTDCCEAKQLPTITSHAFRRTLSTTGEQIGVEEGDMLAAGGWSARSVRDRYYTRPEALKNTAVKKAHAIAEARRFGARVLSDCDEK